MKQSRSISAFVFLLLCTGISVTAYASTPPSALNSIPADCPSVVGINVRQLAASPFFAKLNQDPLKTGQIFGELANLKDKIGLDPARDISYIILAATSIDKTKPQAALIVSGTFDRDKITSYVRSQMSAIEMDYGGASIFMIPEKNARGTKAGISFLGAQELAVGDMESLKAVLDTRSGAKKSILSNPDMTSSLSSIQFDDMFWFAANTPEVLKKTSISTPLGPNQNSIQNSYGSFNWGDNVIGKITATAIDLDSATKTANVFRGLIAFGQLSGNKNPDLKLMLDRVAISQNDRQITLAFDIPGDLIKKFGSAKIQQMGFADKPIPSPAPKSKGWRRVDSLPDGVLDPKTPGMRPPIVLARPVPTYTEEARKAGVNGTVLLQLIVRKDGKPDSIKVMQGLGYGLDESAMNTIANRWRFQPGTLNGTPVDTQIKVEVTFKIFSKPPTP